MTELEPLPPDLRELFGSERDVSPAERVAIRHKLEHTISASPSATSAVASKALWIVIGGVVIATAIWWFSTRERAPAAPPIAPQLSTTAEPELAESLQANEPAPPPAAPSHTGAPAPSHTAAPAPSHTAVPSQADLLARAWQALAKHDTTTTLQLLADDRRFHADGPLSEEREAMQVRALVAAGRATDARAQAKRFFERWPTSMHRHAIEQLIDEAAP